MMRFLAALLALGLLALCGRAEANPVLQPNVTVSGDTIHLGDLFSDAGKEANDPVAPAPALGTRMIFNAAGLAALAREYHLDWSPSSDFDQASVERASRVISADTVAQRILQAIAPSPSDGDAGIRLDNPGLRFIVPAAASASMALDGLSVDPRSGRFSVYVSAPADSATAQRQRVTGRVVYQVSVPVPSRALALGDVLGPSDITMIRLPRERLAADTVTDAQALIGKAARHMLPAGQTVRAGDVEDPIVVHKGDLVTIELTTPTLELTAQGKALDDGAMGADIRIANTQSNRVIEATVAGPNHAVVNGTGILAARS